jgi:hypothetical protein
MNHTPGPWRVNLDFKHTDINYHQIIALDDFKKNGPGFSITGCIGIEDARLIAAAPDLLKALEDIVIWENKITIKDESGEYISTKTNLFEAAEEVIKKAKGL